MRARRDMGVRSDARVMIDSRTGVDNAVGSDDGSGVDHRTGKNDSAVPQFHVLGHRSAGMNHASEPFALPPHLIEHASPHAVVSDAGDHGVMLEFALLDE